MESDVYNSFKQPQKYFKDDPIALPVRTKASVKFVKYPFQFVTFEETVGTRATRYEFCRGEDSDFLNGERKKAKVLTLKKKPKKRNNEESAVRGPLSVENTINQEKSDNMDVHVYRHKRKRDVNETLTSAPMDEEMRKRNEESVLSRLRVNNSELTLKNSRKKKKTDEETVGVETTSEKKEKEFLFHRNTKKSKDMKRNIVKDSSTLVKKPKGKRKVLRKKNTEEIASVLTNKHADNCLPLKNQRRGKKSNLGMKLKKRKNEKVIDGTPIRGDESGQNEKNNELSPPLKKKCEEDLSKNRGEETKKENKMPLQKKICALTGKVEENCALSFLLSKEDEEKVTTGCDLHFHMKKHRIVVIKGKTSTVQQQDDQPEIYEESNLMKPQEKRNGENLIEESSVEKRPGGNRQTKETLAEEDSLKSEDASGEVENRHSRRRERSMSSDFSICSQNLNASEVSWLAKKRRKRVKRKEDKGNEDSSFCNTEVNIPKKKLEEIVLLLKKYMENLKMMTSVHLSNQNEAVDSTVENCGEKQNQVDGFEEMTLSQNEINESLGKDDNQFILEICEGQTTSNLDKMNSTFEESIVVEGEIVNERSSTEETHENKQSNQNETNKIIEESIISKGKAICDDEATAEELPEDGESIEDPTLHDTEVNILKKKVEEIVPQEDCFKSAAGGNTNEEITVLSKKFTRKLKTILQNLSDQNETAGNTLEVRAKIQSQLNACEESEIVGLIEMSSTDEIHEKSSNENQSGSQAEIKNNITEESSEVESKITNSNDKAICDDEETEELFEDGENIEMVELIERLLIEETHEKSQNKIRSKIIEESFEMNGNKIVDFDKTVCNDEEIEELPEDEENIENSTHHDFEESISEKRVEIVPQEDCLKNTDDKTTKEKDILLLLNEYRKKLKMKTISVDFSEQNETPDSAVENGAEIQSQVCASKETSQNEEIDDMKNKTEESDEVHSKIVEGKPICSDEETEEESSSESSSEDTSSEESSEEDESGPSKDTIKRLRSLSVTIPWEVPELHMIETGVSSGPKPKQREEMKRLEIQIKSGIFNKIEDEQIKSNWKEFCRLHDVPQDPTPFTDFSCGKIPLLSTLQRIKFVRFLAHGLDNRILHSVYRRFQRLFCNENMKRGRFTEEEDETIRRFMKKTSKSPYLELAKILNRDRDSIFKRTKVLKDKANEHVKWNKKRIKKFVKYCLRVTGNSKIEDLKDQQFSQQEWLRLSKKMKMPVKKLQCAWSRTIHPRLFIKESVSFKKIKSAVVKILTDRGEDDWRNINWGEIATSFEGFTPYNLNTLFKRMVQVHVPEEKRKSLKDCLDYFNNEFNVEKRLRTRVLKKMVVKDKVLTKKNKGVTKD